MKEKIIRKVNCEDYEIYKMKIPFLLNRNKRNSYINQELEKEHPCFSNSCCYDVKYKLEKSGFVAKVAVMDKVRLAQYKLQMKNKKLFLENENKEKYFNDKKQEYFLRISSVCFAFVIISAFVGIIKNIQIETNGKKEKKIIAENIIYQPKVIIEDICSDIFQIIKEKKGQIASFSYKTGVKNMKNNSSYTSLNIRISNCFPEDIINIKYKELALNHILNVSAVEYLNDIPFFTIDCISENKNYINENEIINNEIIPTVRNAVMVSNGKISYENNLENEISFMIKKDSLHNLLERIFNENKSKYYYVKEIDASVKNEELFITAKFINNKLDKKNIAKVISDYEDLFFPVQEKNKIDFTQTQHNEENNECYKEIVGRISTSNGQKIIFYKDLNGKIKEVRK